jgi:hypothetical protein
MARTRTIKVGELFDPITIDIYGTRFSLLPPTRSREEKTAEKEVEQLEALEKIAEDGLDEKQARKLLMPIFYDMLDLLLEPNTDGDKKVHAKTVIKKLYDGDDPAKPMGLGTIRALIKEISNVRDEERRPT